MPRSKAISEAPLRPTYQILVEGVLDPSWTDSLAGLVISVRAGPEQPPVTVLTGPLTDQAALHGVLDTLFMLNLRLLRVERYSADS